jgi:uncharacterized C2H2 Zn-finger protein
MKANNNSHNYSSAEEVFKDNVKIENNEIIVNPIVPFSLVRELVQFIEKYVKITYSDGEELKCLKCNNILSYNGYNHKNINKTHLVHLQKYKCSDEDCDYTHVTNIDHIVPKHCNYEKSIRDRPKMHNLIGYRFLEKISESIEDDFQVKPVKSTILNFLRETDHDLLEYEEEFYSKLDKSKLSGVISFDEQFPHSNVKSKARPVLMDIGTNVILKDVNIPVEDLTIEFKENFFKTNLDGIDVKGVVSDDNKFYRNIVDDIGVPHQLCNFHLKKNFMNDLLKPMNKIKRKIKSLEEQIENITSNLSNYKYKKVKKKNKKKLKELKIKKEIKRI